MSMSSDLQGSTTSVQAEAAVQCRRCSAWFGTSRGHLCFDLARAVHDLWREMASAAPCVVAALIEPADAVSETFWAVQDDPESIEPCRAIRWIRDYANAWGLPLTYAAIAANLQRVEGRP